MEPRLKLLLGRGQRTEEAGSETVALTELSDEALLAEFKLGRQEAFDVLYRRYREKVYRYLRAMSCDRASAEDVYNSAMFRVYSHLPDGIAPGTFRRYVYKAAYNTYLNALRRGRSVSWQLDGGEPTEADEAGNMSDINPEENIANSQLLHLARSYLEGLPEERRAALLLYHNDGLSYQEIAEVLDKPIGTVRWLIHEARAAMARHLEKHSRARR